MTNKKRNVDIPLSSRSLRMLESKGTTIADLRRLGPKIEGRTYSDKIRVRRLN